MGKTNIKIILIVAGIGIVVLCVAAVYGAVKHFLSICKSSIKSLVQEGRPPIRTNAYEDLLLAEAIRPEHIDIVFESIGGLENVKQQLNELVIQPLKSPDLVSHEKRIVGPLKGVLLHGPPGTGKTMLAQAIVKESGAIFVNVKASTLMCKVSGESERPVAALFTLARKLQPAIIFIDELDDFLGKRKNTDPEVMIDMKNQFMSMWSDFKTDHDARVMILAVTNRPLFEFDEFISSKFYQSFEIGMPNCKERAAILIVALKGERVDDNIDYDYLAGLCEGSTGSDLVELCNKAAYLSLTEAKKNENPDQARRPLTQADLEKVFREYKKTTTAAQEYSSAEACIAIEE